jgi:membrane-bound serine protease (ClpP class)
MEEYQIAIAVILLAVALMLFFVELFIPSGGLIAILGGVAVVSGIFLLFKADTTLGLIGIICTMIAVPCVLAVGMKIWPHTPIGRMLILKDPPPSPVDAHKTAPGQLVGASGEALTDLRPIGTCLIDGKRIDCMAETGIIESGTRVHVTIDDGMQVKVRADALA